MTSEPAGREQSLAAARAATVDWLARQDWVTFERNRSRFPVGSRVHGRVSLVPHPGRVGIFVDVDGDDAPGGFVDGLNLLPDAERWPSVGEHLEFEVTQHTLGQMRLSLVDPDRRGPIWRQDDLAWARIKARYRVGQLVSGTVEMLTGARQHLVALDDLRCVVDYVGEIPPVVGSVRFYRIAALRDSMQLILLTLVD